MGQVTAKNILDVMWWVETTPHHKIEFVYDNPDSKDSKKIKTVLKGHNKDTLIVPTGLWAKCFLKSSSRFDNRMFRWDHDAHKLAWKYSAVGHASLNEGC